MLFRSGSNTTETHPVIGSLIRQAKRKGAKIIVAELFEDQKNYLLRIQREQQVERGEQF